MYKIAVIGAGQLGSRHLQGLSKMNHPSSIYIVDPLDDSLALAAARINEVGLHNTIHTFHYCRFPALLPDSIDLAIVATTADVRLDAMLDLCSNRKIHNIILEKFLFQRIVDYDIAADFIFENKINCWVNCTRRVYPIYSEIKNFFFEG